MAAAALRLAPFAAQVRLVSMQLPGINPPVVPVTRSERPCTETVDWETLVAAPSRPMIVPAGPPRVRSLTSGSTGRPRVIHWTGPQQWERWNGHWSSDRPAIKTSLVTAPLYFGGQYGVFSQAWRQRADLVMLPKFDAEEFLAAVERHHANHAYMVPTMFVRLLRLPQRVRERYDVSSLNYVIHTGATCPLEIKRQMLEWWGPVIWESYGTTETATISACSSAEWLAHPGTVGRPWRATLILDELDQVAVTGQTGRIFVDVTDMPPVASNGQTLPRLRTSSGEYLPTGDVGFVDGDGYLYVSGRADDLINTGRVKVYPLEIENAILQHPAVLDCIVFPVPDPEFGQTIGAVVQASTDDGGLAADVRAFLGQRLSEHKIPARLWIQAQPLRADSGKFNRGAIARHWASSGPAAARLPQ